MIKSFKGDWAQSVFDGISPRHFPANLVRTARRKLEAVNAAAVLQDLQAPPGNRLHALQGDRHGQHAIRINDRFRICLVWSGNDAFDVEIVDYH